METLNLGLNISQYHPPTSSISRSFFACAYLNCSYNLIHNLWLLTNTVKLLTKPYQTFMGEFSNVIS